MAIKIEDLKRRPDNEYRMERFGGWPVETEKGPVLRGINSLAAARAFNVDLVYPYKDQPYRSRMSCPICGEVTGPKADGCSKEKHDEYYDSFPLGKRK